MKNRYFANVCLSCTSAAINYLYVYTVCLKKNHVIHLNLNNFVKVAKHPIALKKF